MQPEVRDGYLALFDTTDVEAESGPRLVELIDQRIGAFTAKYADLYPAAMKIRRSLLVPARLLRPTEDENE